MRCSLAATNDLAGGLLSHATDGLLADGVEGSKVNPLILLLQLSRDFWLVVGDRVIDWVVMGELARENRMANDSIRRIGLVLREQAISVS